MNYIGWILSGSVAYFTGRGLWAQREPQPQFVDWDRIRFQTGDVILFSGNLPTPAGVVRFITGSMFSHAGMVVVQPSGVFLLETNKIDSTTGYGNVQLTPIREAVHYSDSRAVYFRRKKPMRELDVHKIWKYVSKISGAPAATKLATYVENLVGYTPVVKTEASCAETIAYPLSVSTSINCMNCTTPADVHKVVTFSGIYEDGKQIKGA